jgi:two-component system, OmpR family, sensor histidine kinase PhoQ
MAKLIPNNLTIRLILVLSLVLALFMPLSVLVLEQAYNRSLDQRLHEQLKVQVYSLMGLADELEPGQLWLPEALPDERFNQLNSGLYALVTNNLGQPIWRSQSSIDLQLPTALPNVHGEILMEDIRPPGKFFFDTVIFDEQQIETAQVTVIWESSENTEHVYAFMIAQDLTPYLLEKQTFKNRLLFWLGGLAVLLILILFIALVVVMRPLKLLAFEITNIERGKTHQLSEGYPDELRAVATNLNRLIVHEQAQRKRYRNTLQDLAHSLKTPLSILSGIASSRIEQTDQQDIIKQIERMNKLVVYQLQRAASVGASPVGLHVPVKPLVSELIAALAKVYHDKAITFDNQVAENAIFKGDANDLMEMLGNIADNACKYGQGVVHIETKAQSDEQLAIIISDNGDGIPDDKIDYLKQRGQRLDEQFDETIEGQGIGLAIIDELCDAYDGHLSFERTEQMHQVILHLPGYYQ